MNEPLDLARVGFERLAVSPEVKAEALKNLGAWLEGAQYADWRPFLLGMIAAERWEALLDAFYQVLPFGTGGRRGVVGVGPNRFNPSTLCSSVQGHALFLQKAFPGQPLRVVLAYDVRRFEDARGVTPEGVTNPLWGLSSRDFAEMAAGVYAANGISVHMLDRGTTTWVSTPELSFAIRFYQAHGGMNLSASHNPPDDNGAKVYDHHGGQAIPPKDEELAELVADVQDVRGLAWEDIVSRGLLIPIGSDLHEAYVRANLERSLQLDKRGMHVVFTPLHGTADTNVGDVLRAAGFRVTLEPDQAVADGRFPTVPFAAPNPEVPASMDRAVALADRVGAPLVMACDPDADRLGVVVKHRGAWRPLSGNELGALVVRYVLTFRRPRGGVAPIVMKTEVTSSLVANVARAMGAQVVGHLLVGFKYIGDGIRQLERGGSFGNAEGRAEDFTVGVEESHGILVTPHIRDKDAAGAALLLAEAAAWLAEDGRTLVDLLEDCWRDVGFVANVLVSTVMRGATGTARIRAIQDSLRKHPPREIAGRPVTAYHDRLDPRGPFGPIRSGTDAASRDVLVFEMGDRARIILRPSGTEPKNKVYAELAGPPGGTDHAAVVAECQELARAFVLETLRRAGVELPAWGLAVSDLVSVEGKVHFATDLMPTLLARLEAGDAVSAPWLDGQLAGYGRDGRALVRPAVAAWLAANPEATPPVREGLASLFAVG